MIVVDTDIATLISYGTNEKLRRRIQTLQNTDELVITIVTYMEILGGRFDSIVKAATQTELLKAMGLFRRSHEFVSRFRLIELNETAAAHFATFTTGKKKAKMRRGDMLIGTCKQCSS